MTVFVATATAILRWDLTAAGRTPSVCLEGRRPTSLAAGSHAGGPVWCGTDDTGVLRSDDDGRSWRDAGLRGERVTSLAASPARLGLLWAGTEPSAVWRSENGGASWTRCEGLAALASSSEWSFPPRPETHHVRWIACHPTAPGRLWVAIEAGALVTTADGGRSWTDRVEGGPYDTHELAIHPSAPDRLRVAAGDGYFESEDGGQSWDSPDDGLEVGYLRSVAVDPGDPEVVVVSASSHAHAAYAAGRSDGRLFRREGRGPWMRVRSGWPEPPTTIAPLLAPGSAGGELWAADERGIHRSLDRGRTWTAEGEPGRTPPHIRGLVVRRVRAS